VIYALNG